LRKILEGIALAVVLASAFLTLPGAAAQPAQAFVPSGIVEYVPITITNSQPTSTPAPFQQMITVSSAAYAQFEASNLGNVEFFNSTGGIVPSWLESGNNNTATETVYWLRLADGIQAGASTTLYMGFASGSTTLLDGQTVGEAPELSMTYGQYDNGAHIFTFYDNFSGNSLNSTNWVASGDSYSVDDGLTLNAGGNYNTVTSTANLVAPYAIDYYGKATIDSGVYFNVQGVQADSDSYLWAQRPTTELDQFYSYNAENGLTSLGYPPSSYGQYTSYAWWGGSVDSALHVYTLTDGSNDQPLTAQTDYSTKEALASMPNAYVGGHFGPRAYYGIQFWQWVRARAMPPGGVMPSVSFGDLAPNPAVPPISIQLPPATISVVCSPPTAGIGSASTCTATVKGDAPTGTVTWTSGPGTPPSCVLSSGTCSVSFTLSSTASQAAITANYLGDANNGQSSTVFILPVEKSVTTVSAKCSPSPTYTGSIATCVATVVGDSPTGTITWSSSVGAAFVPSPTCSLSGGSCDVFFSPSTSSSPATITATYSGDQNNDGGSGNSSLAVSAPLASSASSSTSLGTNSGSLAVIAVVALAAATVIAVGALAVMALSSRKAGSPRAG
jgi:hypothetical protein